MQWVWWLGIDQTEKISSEKSDILKSIMIELLLVPITLPQFSVYSINLAQLSKIIPGGEKCPEIVVRLLGLQACIEGIYQLPYSGIPIFFHFLRFQGRKALATTLGVWTAITVYFVSLLFGASLEIGMKFIKKEKWVILGGIICMLVGLILWSNDLILGSAWLANRLILFWRYRV